MLKQKLPLRRLGPTAGLCLVVLGLSAGCVFRQLKRLAAHLPFADLRQHSEIATKAKAAGRADFSQAIRAGLSGFITQ